MPSLRKRGLSLTPEAGLKTSRQPDGRWVAWIERDGTPITCEESGKPRIFEGSTRYQAQCSAYRWYCPESSFTVQVKGLLNGETQA